LLDRPKERTLLCMPLCSFLVEEHGIHPPVKLIDVHGVQPALQASVLGLQARDHLVVVAALVAMTLPERLGHPGHYGIVEIETLQEPAEAFLQDLLARVALRALAFRAGAVVVDVPALLDLAH